MGDHVSSSWPLLCWLSGVLHPLNTAVSVGVRTCYRPPNYWINTIKCIKTALKSLNFRSYVFSLQLHAPFLPWSNVRTLPSLVGAACSLTMPLLWGLCSLLLWSGNFKIHRRLFPVLVWCERGPVQKSVFSTTLCSSLLKREKCFAWRN